MWTILAVVSAASLAVCTLDDPQTVDELDSSDPGSEVTATDDFDSYVVAAAEDTNILATSDCLTETTASLPLSRHTRSVLPRATPESRPSSGSAF